MNLVDRAKNILLTPAVEWNVIEPEVTTTKDLYLGYIIILSAIGPLASFLSRTLFHFFFGGLFFGLFILVFSYVLGLVGVFVMALICEFLAPKFGGVSNRMQAMKLMAYSLTAAWVAGIFDLLPVVGSLLVLLAALYGLYLFYLGATPLMKVPADKAVGYTAVVVVVAIVIGIVVGMLFSGFAFMFGGLGTGMMMNGMADHSIERQQRADVAAAQIAAMAAAAAVTASANSSNSSNTGSVPAASGNTDAPQAAAAAAAITAMAGGTGQTVDPIDKEVLKAMLPDSIGAMPRTGVEASKGGIATMQISEADGQYGDQAKSVKLKVIDTGGAKMFGLAAAWAAVEIDRSSDTGYEKTGKVGGRPTHEKFDKSSGSGEYAVLIGNRFLVEADGSNVDMSALKDGVAAIDPSKLEAMKDIGVHKAN